MCSTKDCYQGRKYNVHDEGAGGVSLQDGQLLPREGEEQGLQVQNKSVCRHLETQAWRWGKEVPRRHPPGWPGQQADEILEAAGASASQATWAHHGSRPSAAERAARTGRQGQPPGCLHPRGSQALPSPFPGRVQFGLKVWRNCCEDSKPNPAKTGMDTFSSPFSLRTTACWCQCRATCYHGRGNSPATSPAASPRQHPQHRAEQNHLAADLLNLPGLRNVDVSPAKNRHKSEITWTPAKATYFKHTERLKDKHLYVMQANKPPKFKTRLSRICAFTQREQTFHSAFSKRHDKQS